MIISTSRIKYSVPYPTWRSYLAVQGLLIGQLILQLVVEVMDGGGLTLSSQVTFLQGGDSLLHVVLLSHSLGRRGRDGRVASFSCSHAVCISPQTPGRLCPLHLPCQFLASVHPSHLSFPCWTSPSAQSDTPALPWPSLHTQGI